MHADVFDRYHHSHGPLHQLDARVKVILALLFILSNALLPDGAWPAFGLAWLSLLVVNAISTLGVDFTFKRSFIALPFMLAAVSAIFSPMGQPLANWQVGSIHLIPTDVGLIKFATILLRSWLSVQAGILLVAVTAFPDIIHAFEHLRVPTVLTTITAFLYRYLFILTDEVIRILRGRLSRSAALVGQKSGGSLLWRAKVAGNMAGQLFLRSYERSDRIYQAMLARGYTGHLRTMRAHHMHAKDWLALSIGLTFILFLQLLARLS